MNLRMQPPRSVQDALRLRRRRPQVGEVPLQLGGQHRVVVLPVSASARAGGWRRRGRTSMLVIMPLVYMFSCAARSTKSLSHRSGFVPWSMRLPTGMSISQGCGRRES